VATYDVHLKLIGECVVDFLLVIINLFSLDVTAEAQRTKYLLRFGVFALTGHVYPEISGKQTDGQTGRKPLAIPYVALHALTQ